MQDVLGADFTDFNRIAQPSSFDPDTDHRLHSISGSSFAPLIQAFVRRANALNSISHGRRLRAPKSRGLLCRVGKLHWREFGVGPVLEGESDRPSAKGAATSLYRTHPFRSGFCRAAEGQRAASGCRNMMIDCLRVCHRQFQNEVIGG